MLPFAELRVLELAEGLAGPTCGLYLADLGAEVIKIEPPAGDRARTWGPPMIGDDAAVFVHHNRGKRSVVLDLAHADGRERLEALVATADVLILHVDPEEKRAIGIDWPALAAAHPRLVLCDITDLGPRGPFGGAAGSELVCQAMSGMTRYVGTANGEPIRLGFEIAAAGTAMHAFQGILAALLHREETGRGQTVALSQLGSLMSLKSIQLAAQSKFDEWNGFHLNGPQWPADYGWRTRDGAVSFDFRRNVREGWIKFCRRLGLDHLPDDPAWKRWDLSFDLGDRRFDLGAVYEPILAQMTSDEVTQLVKECGGTAVKFHDYAEVLAHPQTAVADPMIETADDRPGAGLQLGLPFKAHGVDRVERPAAAPRLGEHTHQILRALADATKQVAPSRARSVPAAAAAGPLAGLRIVDASMAAVGPWAGALLGQLGADVVKVEPPAGDMIRHIMPETNGLSTTYLAMNVTKRGVVLDAKGSELASIRKLVAEADVFIQNFRPGVAERIGLGWEDLRQLNPRLVYAAASGWGWSGPLAPVGATDPHVQAFVGACLVNGRENEPPQRWRLFGHFDLTTSLAIVMGVLTACWERRRSGTGRLVEVTMIEAGLAIQRAQLAQHLAGVQPRPLGTATTYVVPDQAFATQDRPLCVSATNQRQWRALCTALGKPELADDPRFATNADRVAHRATLVPLLADRFAKRPILYWTERFRAAGVPCGLFTIFTAFRHHAQWRENAMLVDIETPHGTLTIGGPPWEFSETPAAVSRGPLPGEHNPLLASGIWRSRKSGAPGH
jgi:crotonobetainyl-CoA:carnitine CoA-transferase CaiB-like acyl-CoA transferase